MATQFATTLTRLKTPPSTSRRVMRMLAAVFWAMAIGGCTLTHEPDVAIPPTTSFSIEKRLPLAMGVYYSPEFLAHTHEELCGMTPELLIAEYIEVPIGRHSAATFDRLFAAYFEKALRFAERPHAARPAAGVDAVVMPEIDRLMRSRETRGSMEIDFRFRLVDPSGRPIANWSVTGLGRNVVRVVDGKVVSDSAARSGVGALPWCWDMLAHRLSITLEDAGRNFAKDFARQPKIRRWLISRGIQVAQWRGHGVDPPATDGRTDDNRGKE